MSQLSEQLGYPIVCVHVPKTMDNDLPITDCCPGFGSVAKYVAVSMREAGFDVASMARTSTKVFVLEVMGRHAGWTTAAMGLAAEAAGEAPHILLFPEIPFDAGHVPRARRRCGQAATASCVIGVSEGVQTADGKFLADAGLRDAFGHAQLGGVAPLLANLVKDKLKLKYHWAVADYLQRAARHIASKTDVAQAYAVGKAAVELALKGNNAVMPTIVRKSDKPYQLEHRRGRTSRTSRTSRRSCRATTSPPTASTSRRSAARYLLAPDPGRGLPAVQNGLPAYVLLKNVAVPKKLARSSRSERRRSAASMLLRAGVIVR